MQGITVYDLFGKFYFKYPELAQTYHYFVIGMTLIIATVIGIVAYYAIEKPISQKLNKIYFVKTSVKQ